MQSTMGVVITTELNITCQQPWKLRIKIYFYFYSIYLKIQLQFWYSKCFFI